MHAATTKIPHLLYEKVLLKTRKWCMILFTMYDFLQWIWWEWEKKPRKTYIHKKQGKNPPFGFPPIPPSIKLEADCFPGRKYRKQAGPTLGGAGILLYRDKRNKGSGSAWVDRSGFYDFLHMNVQDLQKADWDTGWGTKIMGVGKILSASD